MERWLGASNMRQNRRFANAEPDALGAAVAARLKEDVRTAQNTNQRPPLSRLYPIDFWTPCVKRSKARDGSKTPRPYALPIARAGLSRVKPAGPFRWHVKPLVGCVAFWLNYRVSETPGRETSRCVHCVVVAE